MKNRLSLFLSFFVATLIFCGASVFGYQAEKDIPFYTGIPDGFNGTVSSLVVQNDNKILVGGSFTSYRGSNVNYIARINSDGTKDDSFTIGSGFNYQVNIIKIQSDGKILVGGDFTNYSGFVSNKIIRLNTDGTRDTSFNIGGGFVGTVNIIEIQNDGKILVGGAFTNYSGTTINRIIRLNSDGTRDLGFNVGGGFNNYVYAITVETGGKILIGGAFTNYSGTNINRIIRLNTGGTVDNSFTVGSAFLGGNVNVITVETGGKIFVGGAFTSYNGTNINRIIRLNTDGTRDTSFNIGGGFDNTVYLIKIQDNNKFLVGGSFTTYSGTTTNDLVLLNTDGTKDTSLNTNGGFAGGVQSIGFQNNKFIVGGSFTSYNSGVATNIISLDSDGTRDTSFSLGSTFNQSIQSIEVQNDGKLIVGGSFNNYAMDSVNYIVRLSTDGTRDTSFNIGSAFNNTVFGIKLQKDEKIIVGGNFTMYNGTNINRIIRLNSDGTRDLGFNVGGGFNNYVYAITVETGGKILIGGNFTTYSGTTANRIIRLNSDGTRDDSFIIGSGFDNNIRSIALQSDGKILIGGQFTTYSGTTANRIIRLNSDGTRDDSFTIGSAFNNNVNTIAIQNDGKILIGGNFTNYSGAGSNYIIRLNSDGTRDTSFNIGSAFNSSVNTIAIESDGKILIGGDFIMYYGITANRIVRVNPDGTRDISFIVGSGFVGTRVNSIAIENNGRIFLGGDFTMYKLQPVINLLALKGNTPIPVTVSATQQDIQDLFTYRGYILSGDQLSGSTRFSLRETNGRIPVSLDLINQKDKLILPVNIQFKKSDNITNYTGEVYPPAVYTGVSSISGKTVIKAISVGNPSESLKLTSGAAILSISTPSTAIGTPVSIYSSQDGIIWSIEEGGMVSLSGGLTGVTFTTNHFTYFAIAENTGYFVINDDDASTTSKNVTLTISTPTAQRMKFANSTGELISASWISYATTYPWTLSDGAGSKTVYAEFDTNGDDTAEASTSDNITLIESGGTDGTLKLEILGGTSECIYGTSLNLGTRTSEINSSYTFTGTFPSDWYCMDYKGISSGWSFTIQTSDLSGNNGGVISGSNVWISHNTPFAEGAGCTGYIGTSTQFYSTALPIMEKISGYNNICKVTLSNVGLQINVPANTTPGDYQGVLTMTLPNGF